MLKGLFAAIAGAAAGLGVLQLGPDGGAGPLEAGGEAGRAPTQEPDLVQDGGLGVRIPADGGPIYLGDPPGRILTPEEGATAGGSANAADAGPPDRGLRADELQQLRRRVAALEQQLAQGRADSQTQLLWQLNEQIAALREQLAQDQARREAEVLATQQARARMQEAVTALSAAQRRLAFGNSQVLDTLDSAYPALPFPAQGAVQNARAAVRSGDLATARYWLSVAIAEAQRAQLGY